jgi:hypothetical protein
MEHHQRSATPFLVICFFMEWESFDTQGLASKWVIGLHLVYALVTSSRKLNPNVLSLFHFSPFLLMLVHKVMVGAKS